MYTPGHTTDHVCIALQEEFAIFTGDCILGEGSTIFENLSDYMKSLVKIRNLNASVIYPGHGPVVEVTNDPWICQRNMIRFSYQLSHFSAFQNAEKKIKEYIDHRQNRENEILSILSNCAGNQTLTVDEIAQKLYAVRDEIPNQLRWTRFKIPNFPRSFWISERIRKFINGSRLQCKTSSGKIAKRW